MYNTNDMRAYVLKNYGFDFPAKAKYKRSENRIYFSTDFQDGEEINFFYLCDKPSSCAEGYAFYASKNTGSRLIHISELEPIHQN